MTDAKREHEQWVRHMQDQGWSHGEVFDEAAKKHPLMVPFDQLVSQQMTAETPAEEPTAEQPEADDTVVEPDADDTVVEPDADDQESGDAYTGETGPAPTENADG